MSLDTYTNLQAEIAGHLNRQDLSGEIPTFIRLAEVKFQRNMRVWQMVARSNANTLVTPAGVMSEYLPLPADYLELKRARVTNAQLPQDPLTYTTMGEIDLLQSAAIEGDTPTSYTIVGNALRLGPIPDKQYNVEIVYYAKLPLLGTNAATNWLLLEHPDYYLYGSLLAAAPYLKDDDRMGIWQDIVEGPEGPTGARMGGILGDLRAANDRAERAGQLAKPLLRRPYGSCY